MYVLFWYDWLYYLGRVMYGILWIRKLDILFVMCYYSFEFNGSVLVFKDMVEVFVEVDFVVDVLIVCFSYFLFYVWEEYVEG